MNTTPHTLTGRTAGSIIAPGQRVHGGVPELLTAWGHKVKMCLVCRLREKCFLVPTFRVGMHIRVGNNNKN